MYPQSKSKTVTRFLQLFRQSTHQDRDGIEPQLLRKYGIPLLRHWYSSKYSCWGTYRWIAAQIFDLSVKRVSQLLCSHLVKILKASNYYACFCINFNACRCTLRENTESSATSSIDIVQSVVVGQRMIAELLRKSSTSQLTV